jgi:hypothetical protein
MCRSLDAIKIHDADTGELLGVGSYALVLACGKERQAYAFLHCGRYQLAPKSSTMGTNWKKVVVRGDGETLDHWLS